MRVLRWISGVLLLLLLVLGPGLLLFTELGLRALALLAPRFDVEIQGVEGNLVTGAGLAQLSYQGDGVHVQARGVELRVDWRCVLHSTVCLRRVHIAGLDIEIAESDEPAKALATPLPWGPDTEVDDLTIGSLLFVSGTTRERIDDIAVRGTLGPEQLRIDHLSLRREAAALSASGTLRPSGEWRVASQLQLADLLPDPQQLTLPGDYQVSAQGDLSSLKASLVAPDKPQLRLELQLRKGDEGLAITGQGNGLETLLADPAILRGVEARGALTFAAALLPAGDMDVQFSQELAGIEAEPLTASVALRSRDSRWRLTQAQLQRNDNPPRMEVSGLLGTLDDLAPELQLYFRDLAPVATLGLPLERLGGAASLKFAMADVAASWQLQSDALVLDAGDRRYALKAALRAAAERLPVGSAQVRGPGPGGEALTVAYERAPDPGAAARLWSLEALQYQDLTLGTAELELVPGDDLTVQLRTEGDIATLLRLRSHEVPTGAELFIEPFTVVYGGQTVRSEAPLRGRWLRDASLLELDALCLAWRDSALCGEGLRLGQEGELNLALSVDEDYRGDISGKPFSVTGTGQGTVALRWSDGAVDYADLDLDFSRLAFDAFVAANTSAPVSFETARLRGHLDSEGETLSLELLSARMGNLNGEFARRAGALDGQLRLDELALAALDDLVPELQLRSGQIDGSVRITGTQAQPLFQGELRLRDGAATLSSLDTDLTEVRLDLNGDTQSLNLDGAARLGGGPLTVQGRCCEDERFHLSLQGERNRLRHTLGLDAIASSELELDITQESLTVRGDLVVHEGVFEHSAMPDGGVPLSNDVLRLDVPEAPSRRFTLAADLGTRIEPGFTLRTSMLEATLGGDLRLQRRVDASTSLFGDLQVLGGELRAYGQTLRLGDGSVGFLGDPLNPDLNLSAVREITSESLSVGFRVRGTLEEPELTLFSDPQLSERETLSYLVRGRGPDAGANVDGTAMALSLGASALNRSGVLAPLESIPGLSDVSLSAEGSDDDVAATISAYVGRRLYLSYGVGLYEPVNALTARLYLRSRLWLEVVSRLESSFDLYYRFDID